MAVVNTNKDMTMLEIAKRTDPGGSIVDIVQTLSERNEFLQYAPWSEGNGNDSHTFTQQLLEHTGTWAGVNEYVAAESARTKQVTENTKILKTYCDISVELLERTRDKAKLRATEATQALNGLMKTFAEAFIYGNENTTPDELHGLASRGDYDAAADAQVIDAGGSGSDTMSMWLVKFGYPNNVYFFYPPGGTNTMIQSEDMGREAKYDSSGNIKHVMREQLKLNVGLAIGDPRSVMRIASIETSGSSNIWDFDDLVDGISKLPDPGDLSGTVLMTNRTGWAQIWKDASSKSNVNFIPNAPYGTPVRSIADIPVILMDQLIITETAL